MDISLATGQPLAQYQMEVSPSSRRLTTAYARCVKTVGYEDLSAPNASRGNGAYFLILTQDASQTQGLDLPGTSGGCADSCSKSLDDEVGKPVGTAGSYGCLAATEVGITNRFGHLTSGNVCTYAVDGAAQSSSQFSCVCLFSPGLAPVSTTQQIQPLVAAATAG